MSPGAVLPRKEALNIGDCELVEGNGHFHDGAEDDTFPVIHIGLL